MANWAELDTAPLTTGDAELVPDDEPSQLERIRSLEDELLIESGSVVRDVINFADIGPEDTEPPEKWTREMGVEAAMKRFRHMKAAWCGSKIAPVALGINASVYTKIIKARNVERAAPRALAIVLMPAPNAPMPAFEVRDVDEG